jgi:GNAT superfamily N-acetyltransferase
MTRASSHTCAIRTAAAPRRPAGRLTAVRRGDRLGGLGAPILERDAFVVAPIVDVSDSVLAEMATLYALLDPALPPPRRELVETAIASRGVSVLAALTPERVGGLATLVAVATPLRVRAWAEDLVVHPTCRRIGVASGLMEACAQLAAQHGADSLEGTVHPERTAAVALYRRTGWTFGRSAVVTRQTGIAR